MLTDQVSNRQMVRKAGQGESVV